jgi:hypothetical protein
MKKHEFEGQLRELLRKDPFQPFVVLVSDGRAIHVDEPSIAFGGGRAGFIGPDDLVEFFNWQNVVGFRPAGYETAP